MSKHIRRLTELAVLTASVNPERLGNHPFSLTPADLETLYRSILL